MLNKIQRLKFYSYSGMVILALGFICGAVGILYPDQLERLTLFWAQTTVFLFLMAVAELSVTWIGTLIYKLTNKKKGRK